MASVAILIDYQEGHFFSTFRLAGELRSRGHRVCYLGFAELGDLARKEGFEFLPVLGQRTEGRVRKRRPLMLPLKPLLEGSLSHCLEELKCDVLLTLTLLSFEALVVKYRCRIPVVLLRNAFSRRSHSTLCRGIATQTLMEASDGVHNIIDLLTRSGISIRRLSDVAALASDLPEIVLFPEFLGSGEMANDDRLCYAGFAVAGRSADAAFEWPDLYPGAKIIYCALGSQTRMFRDAAFRVFQMAIEAVAGQNDLELMLATGRNFNGDDLPRGAPNVHIYEWLPQMEVLRRADMMINHGGIGSVQECIMMGVPMLMFPMVNDQFDCADTVAQRNLGIRGEPAGNSPGKLLSLIRQALTPDQKLKLLEAQRSVPAGCLPAIDMIEKVCSGAVPSRPEMGKYSQAV